MLTISEVLWDSFEDNLQEAVKIDIRDVGLKIITVKPLMEDEPNVKT